MAWLPLSVAMALAATALGAVLAGVQASVPPLGPARAATSIGEEFRSIAANNLAAMGWMLFGVGSFGVYGVYVLLWNAFRIGFDVVYVARAAPHDLWYLIQYLPLEYLALCLMSSVALSLGAALFGYLADGRPPAHLAQSLRLVSAVCLIILFAAAFEAYLMQERGAPS